MNFTLAVIGKFDSKDRIVIGCILYIKEGSHGTFCLAFYSAVGGNYCYGCDCCGYLVLSVFAMLAACASRAAATLSATSCRMASRVMAGAADVDSGGGVVDLTGDEDPTDEDGDTRMGDSIRVSVSLGGEISSGGKKSRELNIGDSDNIGDGGKTAGRAILTWGGGITLLISESEGMIVE
ncbi:hypothetical protein Tco_0988631 [Tanacetum coccineum]|uniref:Uncharacterized protein n=1 Tax=Tanacetum coccineum TaxID=301880 RepID=A0ABQ5EST9_9ASTR